MTDRLNIMLIVAEDTGRHQGCYGDATARTPNLDRLAAEGCRYSHAFSHTPVCAPSRAGLVSGRYPTSLGAHHHRSMLNEAPRLFTHVLRDAGYFVAWPTKLDFNFQPADDFRDTKENWLEQGPGVLRGRPFFAYVNLGVTHESTLWGEDGYEKQVLPELAEHERTAPADVTVPPYLPDTPAVRSDLARYYDALAVQDKQLGQALATLEATGEADNTIVLYLSDHGRGLPREKRWCYDAGVRLPLVVRWPGQVEPGTVADELVAWVDIAPTLLSLAGVPIPEDYQGQVFLGSQRDQPRQYVFGGRDRMDEAYDRVRFARDAQYHYIRNFYPQIPYAQRNHYMERMASMQALREQHAAGQLQGPAAVFMQTTKPAEELYDPAADPDMVHNLAADPAHADTLARLRSALDRWLDETGDLGTLPEQALIDRGLVADRLVEHAKKIEPLPERHRIGPELTVLTMQQAEAQAQQV